MQVKYKINLNLVLDKTIGEIKNISLMVTSKGGSEKAGIEKEVGIACLYVWNGLQRLGFTEFGYKLTLRDLYDLDEKFGEEFIHIHRMNYMTYRVIDNLYTYLEDNKLIKFEVKRSWKKIHKVFKDYQSKHKSLLEESAFYTVVDHSRLAFDQVEPMLAPLEAAIRDFLILKRQKIYDAKQRDDITMLSKLQVCLMFCAATRNTRQEYFNTCIKKFGVDLSCDYVYADLSDLCVKLVQTMGFLGVVFEKDKEGDYVMRGINPLNNLRVKSAWDRVTDIVTDEELMDKTALAAINYNPTIKASYEKVLAEVEKKEMSFAIESLSNKYKVSTL